MMVYVYAKRTARHCYHFLVHVIVLLVFSSLGIPHFFCRRSLSCQTVIIIIIVVISGSRIHLAGCIFCGVVVVEQGTIHS